jgi:hypothetical protein
MRWDALFADLEGQFAAAQTEERAAEITERARAEAGRLRLSDRLRVAVDDRLRLRCLGGVQVAGVLSAVGADWVLVREGAGGEALVATGAVVSVAGLSRYSAVPDSEGILASRLVLRHALRVIVQDRSSVRAHLVSGECVDGTIDRIGADHVDVAVHAAGELRRRREVRESVSIAIDGLVAVRRAVVA